MIYHIIFSKLIDLSMIRYILNLLYNKADSLFFFFYQGFQIEFSAGAIFDVFDLMAGYATYPVDVLFTFHVAYTLFFSFTLSLSLFLSLTHLSKPCVKPHRYFTTRRKRFKIKYRYRVKTCFELSRRFSIYLYR